MENIFEGLEMHEMASDHHLIIAVIKVKLNTKLQRKGKRFEVKKFSLEVRGV